MKKYELPALPYAYDALEPHMDKETVTLHHDKHHKAYVDGANAQLEKLEKARTAGDYAVVKAAERDLAFHLCGHLNHTLFWENLKPNGGGLPTGKIADQINIDFGSFEAFKGHFTAAAAQVEGSGWAMLVWEPHNKQLLIQSAENHQDQTINGVCVLLVLDLWEHAYYLKYQNRRPDFIAAWWNIVNWEVVEERYKKAVNCCC